VMDTRPVICDAIMRNSPQGITDRSREKETQVAMENIANAGPLDYLKHLPTELPTDGNKITPGMLDSKADLQALIDGAEMFRVVETIEPIDVNKCPGFSLSHGYLA